jgi:hypothetical protein
MDSSKNCNWLTEQLAGLPLVSYPFDLEALPTNGKCISAGAKIGRSSLTNRGLRLELCQTAAKRCS